MFGAHDSATPGAALLGLSSNPAESENRRFIQPRYTSKESAKSVLEDSNYCWSFSIFFDKVE